MYLRATHSENQCKLNTSQWVLPPIPTLLSLKTVTPSPWELLVATALPTPLPFYLCVHAYVCFSVLLLCACLYITEITCSIWPCVLTNHKLLWVTHLLYFSILTSWYQRIKFIWQDYVMLCSKASLAHVKAFGIWTTHLSEVSWWEDDTCILMI